MSTILPENVEQDIVAGFVMTDIDDGFQRCKKLSKTVFQYRCEVNGETHEETVDVDDVDTEEAISGYYDSIDDLIEENGVADANMLIAECYFENNCPMQIPS
jgi:hypothetical protein